MEGAHIYNLCVSSICTAWMSKSLTLDLRHLWSSFGFYLLKGFRQYVLKVFPSKEVEQHFIANDP